MSSYNIDDMKLNVRFFLLLMACFFTFPFAEGQTATSTISGRIIALDQHGVFSATIALRKNEDKTTIKFAVTDSMGIFEFDQIPYGEYVVSVTCTGYERYVSDPFVLKTPSTDLGTMILDSAVTSLNEVTITAVKPIVEWKPDRTIVNVSNSITMSGGTGLEALAQSPGVSINANGKISVKGKEGSVVLVDGRLIYLTGADLTNYLKSLQASQIDKIEIISNPSAKYEAAGNSVINIITKTENKKGWGAVMALSYRQGRYASTADNVILNYRSEKVNVGASLNYQRVNGFQDYYVLRNLRDMQTDGIKTIFDQHSYQKTTNTSVNARVNVDYYLNVKTVIGLGITYFDNPTHSSGYSTTLLKSPDNITQQRVTANTATEGTWHNPFYNFNVKRALGNNGQNLSLDLNYVNYKTNDEQRFDNYFYEEGQNTPDTTQFFRARFPRTIKIGSAKIDYEIPVTPNDKLELGGKYSQVKSDNEALYGNEIGGKLFPDSDASNHFLFKEQIGAGYVNYKKQMDKFGFQAGLRVERTATRGTQLTTGEKNDRDYIQWFPTLSLNYELSEEHSFGISYGRRIERPEYQNMNPFKYYIDKYTYEQGNPYLKPQTSNNIELSYLLMEGLLSASLSYSKVDNPILSVVLQDIDKNETFLIPQNMRSSTMVGLNLSGTIPVFPGFNAVVNLSLNNQDIKGEINGLNYSLSKLQFYGTILNQYKFGKGWSAELFGQYASTSIDETFIRRPYGTVSIGVSKSILDKKGTVRLSCADVFYTNQFVSSSRYQHVDVYAENKFQTRAIRVAFTYRLNSSSKPDDKKNQPEETERVRLKQ